MTELMTTMTLISVAYLVGSISSAIIVCRMMGLPDPRTQGSLNPGATNVLRIGGARGQQAAAITLLGDSLKGLIPVLIAQNLHVSHNIVALTGLAAFLGHLYPVFFKFQGGKGVATALGIQFAINWWLGIISVAIWLTAAKLLKISSFAALLSMAIAPILVWFLTHITSLTGMQLIITGLLFWRHRRNIHGLLTGTETKITLQDRETHSEPKP
jgi:glycerol-3-phosphate acyltransferase PlsY